MESYNLKKKELISCIIENTYSIKKSYISKWFSTQEIQVEVLTEEEKAIYKNGIFSEYEAIIHHTFREGYQTRKKGKYTIKSKEESVCEFDNYEMDGTKKASETHYYNSHNDLIESIYLENRLFGGGFETYKYQFFYNNKNLKCKSIDYKGEVTRYEYNSLNQTTKKTTLNPQGQEILIKEFIYNNLNQCVKIITTDKVNGKREISTYKDDSYDNTIYMQYCDNGVEIIITYEYKYDEYGNWIEMRQYRNNIFNLLRTRTIQYND